MVKLAESIYDHIITVYSVKYTYAPASRFE